VQEWNQEIPVIVVWRTVMTEEIVGSGLRPIPEQETASTPTV
jgi:hypothetical protein